MILFFAILATSEDRRDIDPSIKKQAEEMEKWKEELDDFLEIKKFEEEKIKALKAKKDEAEKNGENTRNLRRKIDRMQRRLEDLELSFLSRGPGQFSNIPDYRSIAKSNRVSKIKGEFMFDSDYDYSYDSDISDDSEFLARKKKGNKDSRDPKRKDSRNNRFSKDRRDPRDDREFRDPRDDKEFRDPRDDKKFRDPRDDREFRDPMRDKHFGHRKNRHSESDSDRPISSRSGNNHKDRRMHEAEKERFRGPLNDEI